MENIILILIIGGILFLIRKLTKLEIKLDDAAIGIDNPYYDNKRNSMPLEKYEKELDEYFDNSTNYKAVDDTYRENMNLPDLDSKEYQEYLMKKYPENFENLKLLGNTLEEAKKKLK